MVLTQKQEEGLKIAVARYNNHEKYTIISGYAGTGKSTLVRFIISALGVKENKVCYATFTGKAAEVLRKKGNNNAITLHKLLYEFIPLRNGGFLKKPKSVLEYDVIVVDEVSMVPKEMIDLLFKHQVYVICLGDPFQIPPIEKETDNHLLDNPHVFLDEIMRQEEESEIIRLSMDVRNMKPLSLYQGSHVQVIDKNELIDGMLTWADQVIVATNAKRNDLNKRMRNLFGYAGEPKEGDKVICLRNYWDECSINSNALVNGTIGVLGAPQTKTIGIPTAARTSLRSFEVIQSSIITDNGEDSFVGLSIDKDLIISGNSTLSWQDSYALGRLAVKYGDLRPKEFSYGYAITCHKAQGSSWSKVLVFEENFPFDRTEHARWLYTAITRAEDKLVIVRK